MSAAKSRKWQSIDVETILSPPFLQEDTEEFQDEGMTETELDEPVFDDFGVEPSKSVPRPTFETKRCPGALGAHLVLQAGPGQRSSELASETRPSHKRKANAEYSTPPSEVDESQLPKIAEKSTPLPPPQQPWHTACEIPSCPIEYPHNFGLSPFEPPSQLLPKHDLVATGAEAGKQNKPGQKRKSEKQDKAGKKRKVDEEDVADEHFEDKAVGFLDVDDEEYFLGRSPYMPSEIDSAEARRAKRTGFTPEDKKLLQAFYTAHGGKQQYYGFLGSEIKYQKHREGQRRPPKPRKGGKNTSSKESAKTAKGKRDNSKSEYRILPHG